MPTIDILLLLLLAAAAAAAVVLVLILVVVAAAAVVVIMIIIMHSSYKVAFLTRAKLTALTKNLRKITFIYISTNRTLGIVFCHKSC